MCFYIVFQLIKLSFIFLISIRDKIKSIKMNLNIVLVYIYFYIFKTFSLCNKKLNKKIMIKSMFIFIIHYSNFFWDIKNKFCK